MIFLENNMELVDKKVFNLSERRIFKNLYNVFLTIENLIIYKHKDNVIIKSEDVNNETEMLNACLKLGKFFYDNNGLLEKIAIDYVQTKYIEEYSKIYSNSLIKKENICIVPEKLVGKYKNIDLAKVNNINYDCLKLPETIYLKNDELLNLIKYYLNNCGIPTDLVVENYGENLFYSIDMKYLIPIFDLCLSLYKLNIKIANNTFEEFDIPFKLRVRINNHQLEIVKKAINLENLMYLTLFSVPKTGDRHLRQCLYCGVLFYGSNKQKYCTDYCKDLKNGKYEKRKIRNQSKKIKN